MTLCRTPGLVVEQCHELRLADLKGELGQLPDTVAIRFGGLAQVLHIARDPGRRSYLECPACRKRVGSLFLPPGAAAFACRYCQGLKYVRQLTSRNTGLRAAVKTRDEPERSALDRAKAALDLCAEVDAGLGRDDPRLLADRSILETMRGALDPRGDR